ncbi:hypothetical protein PIB30_107523, partial [Stylosanthes scabra]|nr:hypothetical protein [Stylosanthes scabra]
ECSQIPLNIQCEEGATLEQDNNLEVENCTQWASLMCQEAFWHIPSADVRQGWAVNISWFRTVV